jgi:integrase
MGGREIQGFLNHLADAEQVSAATQNQALNALVFLYCSVLEREMPELDGLVRARKPRRLPVVLSQREVRAVLAEMHGTAQLVASLLYGSGLRLSECLALRVKDVDFDLREICVRQGKGRKDRVTPLPDACIEPLRAHLRRVRALFARDLAEGFAGVHLPDALERKYPRAPREWGWQWVFPARSRFTSSDRSVWRHHLHETAVQRAVRPRGPSERFRSCSDIGTSRQP